MNCSDLCWSNVLYIRQLLKWNILGTMFWYLAWSAPFVTSCEVVRKLGSFRLTAPAAVLGHLGDISLKLPNFLTTSQDITKGADQANYNMSGSGSYSTYISYHTILYYINLAQSFGFMPSILFVFLDQLSENCIKWTKSFEKIGGKEYEILYFTVISHY